VSGVEDETLQQSVDLSIDDGSGTADPGFFDELQDLFGKSKNAAFSAADSLKAALEGVTLADVKAGKVKEETLSREQRAQLHIDGATGGALPNPWSVLFDLSPSDVAQIGAGAVLIFDVTTAAPLAIVDDLSPPRFALLWDDQIVETRGTVPTAVFGTSTLLASVGTPQGRTLTLYSDGTVGATLRKVSHESLDKIAAEEKAAKGEESNPLKAAFDKFVNVQLGVGLAVVVVVGVAIVLLIESGQLSKTAAALRPGV
jgi:hypothetical protein